MRMKYSELVEKYKENEGCDFELSVSNVAIPFILGFSEGMEVLELTGKEYRYLATRFQDSLPWDWDGAKIWNVELEIIDNDHA